MRKIPRPINFTSAILNIMDKQAQALQLTRSKYIESIFISNIYKTGYKPTDEELEKLTNGFLMNSQSSISWDFRCQLSYLSNDARFATIAFFYNLNLIPGIKVNTNKHANFYKNDNLIFYFAVGIIGNQSMHVYDYVQSLSHPKYILGPSNCPPNEYIFISNLQHFKTPSNYVHFPKLCQLLNIPSDKKIIQVHYTKLQDLLEAISLI